MYVSMAKTKGEKRDQDDDESVSSGKKYGGFFLWFDTDETLGLFGAYCCLFSNICYLLKGTKKINNILLIFFVIL